MNAVAVIALHWPNAHILALKRKLKLLNVANMGLLAITGSALPTFTVFPLDIQTA